MIEEGTKKKINRKDKTRLGSKDQCQLETDNFARKNA